jgi:hypothetical protein
MLAIWSVASLVVAEVEEEEVLLNIYCYYTGEKKSTE